VADTAGTAQIVTTYPGSANPKQESFGVNNSRRFGRMTRKTRSDKTVGKIEKDLGLATGVIRNKDGRDTRSDKKLGTIRKEQTK
jgi:hypothetical protein